MQRSSRVVSFTVHKNTRDKHERRRIYEHLKDSVNNIAKDADGYMMIAIKRDGETVYTQTGWSARDARDYRYMLDLLKEDLARSSD